MGDVVYNCENIWKPTTSDLAAQHSADTWWSEEVLQKIEMVCVLHHAFYLFYTVKCNSTFQKLLSKPKLILLFFIAKIKTRAEWKKIRTNIKNDSFQTLEV